MTSMRPLILVILVFLTACTAPGSPEPPVSEEEPGAPTVQAFTPEVTVQTEAYPEPASTDPAIDPYPAFTETPAEVEPYPVTTDPEGIVETAEAAVTDGANDPSTPGATAEAAIDPANPAASTETSRPASDPGQTRLPSGTVVYVRNDDALGHSEVWQVHEDGSGDGLLFACPDNCTIGGLAVAPGGTYLAYVAVSPDQPTSLHVVRPDGREGRTIDIGTDTTDLVFSPDGTKLAFVRAQQTGEASGDQQSIWVTEIAGGEPRMVVPWATAVWAMTWDGNDHLLYSARATAGAGEQVLRVSLEANAQPEALFEGRLAALSPDGSAMLVWLEPTDSDVASVYEQPSAYGIVSLNGEAPSIVQSLKLPTTPFAWSPDGSTIAQTIGSEVQLVRVADGAEALVEVRPDQEGPARGVGIAASPELAWTPDGRGVIYARGVQLPDPAVWLEIRRLAVDNGRERALTSFPWQGAAYFVVVP